MNRTVQDMVRKAFQTTACGVTSIVFHESAGKARYATYLCATDAGYRVAIPQITVRRRPDLDGAMTRYGGIPVTGKCICCDDFANARNHDSSDSEIA